MKYFLQISLPFLLSWRYFLSRAHIKGHKICWKHLCHSLEGSPYLITNNRASSYPLMFSKGKKTKPKQTNFFCFFEGNMMLSPPTLQFPYLPPTKGPKEILNYVIVFILIKIWFTGFCASILFISLLKSFDQWCIDWLSNYLRLSFSFWFSFINIYWLPLCAMHALTMLGAKAPLQISS